jgi:(p)ppGpp synthase/HD superfamily hydrolase
VHTDIGNRCVACRINHELMPLRTELRNGDQVEVITASHANPNPAWLSYVKTGKARSQIRHFLKTVQQAESARLGERLLTRALADLSAGLDMIKEATWEKVLRESGAKAKEEVMTDIGLGKRMAPVVARRLLLHGETQQAEVRAAGPVPIRGTEGMAVQLARCCQPIPGDPIIGSIKKGQGLVVHVFDCPGIIRSRVQEADKWLDVEWAPESGRFFDTRIRVVAQNAPGVLAKVAGGIAEAGSNILNVNMDEERDACTALDFILQVNDRVHLARIMRALRHIPEVVRISRVRE